MQRPQYILCVLGGADILLLQMQKMLPSTGLYAGQQSFKFPGKAAGVRQATMKAGAHTHHGLEGPW